MIEVFLELDYDVNTAMAEMLSKINEVQGRLPKDITDPNIKIPYEYPKKVKMRSYSPVTKGRHPSRGVQ